MKWNVIKLVLKKTNLLSKISEWKKKKRKRERKKEKKNWEAESDRSE